MDKHIALLGWLHIGFSCVMIVIASFVFLLLGGMGAYFFLLEGDGGLLILPFIGLAVASLLTLLALPGLVGGVGLLRQQRWGRTVVLVISLVHFLNFPLGTILGAYSFWALMRKEADLYFEPEYSTTY